MGKLLSKAVLPLRFVLKQKYKVRAMHDYGTLQSDVKIGADIAVHTVYSSLIILIIFLITAMFAASNFI